MSVEPGTESVYDVNTKGSLQSATPPIAQGPAGPDADSLRTAYLDLLKLTLTDLAHRTSVSVAPRPDGSVVARELFGELRRFRSVGMDWPFQALTMGGLRRLKDLEACVASIVRDDIPGAILEAGAWRGGSSILVRATLDALGDRQRPVWVCDSFEGFTPPEDPADDRGGLNAKLSTWDFLSIPVEEVEENFERLGLNHDLVFLKGYFQETLPPLTGKHQWSMIRLDGDTFEATDVALRALYDDLAPGGYAVIDDYGIAAECREATDVFRAERGITAPLEKVDFTCFRWRKPAADGSDWPDTPSAPPIAEEVTLTDEELMIPTLTVPTAREGELEDVAALLQKGSDDLIARLSRRDALLVKLCDPAHGVPEGVREEIRDLLLSGD